jgi:hypothetical protein
MGAWGGAWLGSEPGLGGAEKRAAAAAAYFFSTASSGGGIRIIVMKVLVHYWLFAEYIFLVWPQQRTRSIALVVSSKDAES